tara:strand:- start:666 stop:1328 length:663 start_codon:yes stop_codon:yes gene_type:complete
MQIEIEVPSNLSEITLSQYTRYLKLVETNKDVENIDRFMSLKMLEIFCNVPYKESVKLKITNVNRVIDHLVEILNSQPELVQTFSIGDTEFGFIPKLDDMTFGEYIDLDQFLGNWDDMYKAMAVLYRPINKRIGRFYNIKEYTGDSYWDAMKHTPLDAVFGSTVFFYHLGIDLSKLMTNSLLEDQMQETLHKDLAKSGVGINQFTHSLKEMLDDMKISQQ